MKIAFAVNQKHVINKAPAVACIIPDQFPLADYIPHVVEEFEEIAVYGNHCVFAVCHGHGIFMFVPVIGVQGNRGTELGRVPDFDSHNPGFILGNLPLPVSAVQFMGDHFPLKSDLDRGIFIGNGIFAVKGPSVRFGGLSSLKIVQRKHRAFSF